MKKKILVLVNNLDFLISHRLDILKAAKDEGYEVIVVYGQLGKRNINTISNMGISCIQIPLISKSINPFLELRTLYSIFSIFQKLKPDIVHLITIKAYLYGGIAARLARVPAVVSAIAGLGIFFNKKKWWNLLFQKLLYFVFYFAFKHPNQKVIVQNLEDQKTLIKFICLNKNKFLLFKGSGVDLSKFSILKEENTVPKVCFASRLLYEKGVYDFINAAKIIKKKGINAEFLLAGSTDPNNPTSLNFKDLQNIKKEKAVKLLGFKKNIPQLFSKSHIICLPSFYGEGLPKVLIEAAAASRAIVTTNISGCRDALIPNKTGLLVPVKNPKKLANAIHWLIKNPKKRVAMGKLGRKLAEKEFPIKKIVQKHIKLYRDILR